MKIGEAMYARAAAAQDGDGDGDPVGAAAGTQDSAAESSDDSVVDAEFRATDESDSEGKEEATGGEKR